MSTEVKMSEIPDCDICKQAGVKEQAAYDGKTTWGPWAYMCETHWMLVGPGKLGVGFGQRLIRRE